MSMNNVPLDDDFLHLDVARTTYINLNMLHAMARWTPPRAYTTSLAATRVPLF